MGDYPQLEALARARRAAGKPVAGASIEQRVAVLEGVVSELTAVLTGVLYGDRAWSADFVPPIPDIPPDPPGPPDPPDTPDPPDPDPMEEQ